MKAVPITRCGFRCLLVLLGTLGPVSSGAPAEISGGVVIREEGGASSTLSLRDAVVYVDELQAPIPEGESEPRSIVMENKTFSPRVLVVPRGGRVSFPNRDEIMHNAFSLSRGNRFDLGLYKSGASKSQQFDTPGLARLYCNIHPQMSAFVLVVDNPYFARVDSNGSYRIRNIPPGIYTVKVWSEKGEVDKRVIVGERGAEDVNFEIDARRFKPKPHLNKFGRPYKRERY